MLKHIPPFRPPQASPGSNFVTAGRERTRRQRLIEHLHDLGPAPLGHFLREIESGSSISDRLEAYARIDPEFVRAVGGDRFAPALYAIEGSAQ